MYLLLLLDLLFLPTTKMAAPIRYGGIRVCYVVDSFSLLPIEVYTFLIQHFIDQSPYSYGIARMKRGLTMKEGTRIKNDKITATSPNEGCLHFMCIVIVS